MNYLHLIFFNRFVSEVHEYNSSVETKPSWPSKIEKLH